jgi:hypothetical protein
MKLANYLLIAIVLLTAISCSSASKTSAENVSVSVANAERFESAQTNAAAAETAAAAQTVVAPDALIKDLYKTHDKNYGAIVQGKNRAILDKYFDKNLGGLIWKDMTTNQNEVGVIDFDIFYNTQDPEIKNLVVGAAKINGDKAVVPVTFDNFKEKNSINYNLIKEKSVWKISDIDYGEGNTLLKYFKESNENVSDAKTSVSGEFEGVYQIGETTCTVKPVKMAFEVKWAKGTGTEMFFSEGRADDRYIFASNPPNGKANSFAFDDENYNSGTFYRADGKEFPIKRLK